MTDCNFSHDGKLVVSCSDLDRSIKLWDATSGKMVKEIVGRKSQNQIMSILSTLSEIKLKEQREVSNLFLEKPMIAAHIKYLPSFSPFDRLEAEVEVLSHSFMQEYSNLLLLLLSDSKIDYLQICTRVP